jgi:hypothetical protein
LYYSRFLNSFFFSSFLLICDHLSFDLYRNNPFRSKFTVVLCSVLLCSVVLCFYVIILIEITSEYRNSALRSNFGLASKFGSWKSWTQLMKRQPYIGLAESVGGISQNPKCYPVTPNCSFSSPTKSVNPSHCQIVSFESAPRSPVLLILIVEKLMSCDIN